MKLTLRKKKWTIFVAIAATLSLGYCANGKLFASESSGTVIDTSTRQTLEGAYVIAVYHESGSIPFGHSASWCIKTKGMYSGKDGKYHFPLNHGGIPIIYAIKADYFWTLDEVDTHEKLRESDWKGDWVPVQSNNFYFKPQDPAKPKFSVYVECDRPQTHEDVTANIEYAKLYLAELVKYNKSQIDMLKSIQRLESLPSKNTVPAK